jgi:membrane-bound lytic murein transglycosylase MltF
LIKITVVDSHIAEFWDQVFDQITVHQDLAVASGGQIAWALRKNCPQLEAEVSAFTKSHGKGTLFGNVVLKKYLKDVRYVRNSTSEAEMKRFRQAVDYFKKYAGQYGFDWLMVAAQAYQESRIDQSLRSPVGAVGVMQIKPETAADRNVNIPNVHELEDNIHAGIKYLRFMMDHYFKDAPMDRINKGLFAFASYNAGPARIARLRQQAGELGLDPNKWFYNVELVAAKSIGRETVQYVSNIFKYYLAYTIVLEQHTQKEGKKTGARQPA